VEAVVLLLHLTQSLAAVVDQAVDQEVRAEALTPTMGQEILQAQHHLKETVEAKHTMAEAEASLAEAEAVVLLLSEGIPQVQIPALLVLEVMDQRLQSTQTHTLEAVEAVVTLLLVQIIQALADQVALAVEVMADLGKAQLLRLKVLPTLEAVAVVELLVLLHQPQVLVPQVAQVLSSSKSQTHSVQTSLKV